MSHRNLKYLNDNRIVYRCMPITDKKGKTKVKHPNGRHNSYPSRAIDVTPYPVDWEDRERQTLFAGFVIGMARQMGIKLRWGGDWDMDFQVMDNRFDDFPHFEVRDES